MLKSTPARQLDAPATCFQPRDPFRGVVIDDFFAVDCAAEFPLFERAVSPLVSSSFRLQPATVARADAAIGANGLDSLRWT